MKIEPVQMFTKFASVRVGDVFLYVDTFYMRIPEITIIEEGNTITRNCVCLLDGSLGTFNDNEGITIVELTVTAKAVI